MILRNIVLLLVLSLFPFNSSFGRETKTNYIIKDTANYIHKKSYFYEKTKYDGIFKKSISAINSYSEEILIKILDRNSYKIVLQIQGKDKTSQLKLQRNSSIKDVGRNLTLLLEVLRRDYSLKKEDMQLNYLIANTMLQEVDEYSSIIHPDFYDDFLIESKGSFGGLGIVIGMRDERLTIISPIEGTPAFKAGVKANDKISRIENFETEGFTLSQAIKLLRGEKGTPVTIYVERENENNLIKFRIVRDIIKIESIKSKKINNKIGYIKINSFQSNTYTQFLSSLKELRNEGITSLILDLRGNPGGLFDQALRISNIFLKEKLIVSTKSKSREMNINFFTNPTETAKFDGPLVVLTDGGSASASEIVTGAIKNNQRGIVIGQQTFGKGTVQEIYEQDDGSGIKLTIAEYLNPLNYKVHLAGISPDINFIPIRIEEEVLITDKEIEKELLDTENSSKFNIIYSPEDLEDSQIDELISFSSYILDLELLNKIQLRGNTKNFLSMLESSISEEAARISASFTKSLSSAPPRKKDNGARVGTPIIKVLNPEIISFSPGSKKVIEGSIVNNSNQNFSNLIIKSESENKTFNNKYFYIGKIDKNKEENFSISLNLPTWLKTSSDIVELILLELDTNKSLDPTLSEISRISLNTKVIQKKFIFPKFSYSLRPNVSDKAISFDLIMELSNPPSNCNECFIKILSRDKKLIIKNKKHKISSQNNKNFNITSVLYVSENDVDNEDISFKIRFHDEDTNAFFDKDILISKKELLSYKSQDSNYKVLQQSILYSEPSLKGIVLGEVNENSTIESIGATQDFILVSSNNGRMLSWIERKSVEAFEDKDESGSKHKLQRAYEEPPKILIKSIERLEEGGVHINAEISDDSRIKNINYFLNDEKVRLMISEDKVITEDFELKLEPGRNKLHIVASDKKDIKTYREIYLTRNDE